MSKKFEKGQDVQIKPDGYKAKVVGIGKDVVMIKRKNDCRRRFMRVKPEKLKKIKGRTSYIKH